MEQRRTLFREAQPIFDEGVAYARYLDQAAEGFFRLILGRRFTNIIANAYTQPQHDYSYQNVIFAERDGVIVGMAAGYTGEQHRSFSKTPLKQTLRMRGARILLTPMWRILENLPDEDFYIQAIAVDKELRDEGIGSGLIDTIEDQARAIGAARLALDVSAKNQGAHKLYVRRGMTIESEWPNLLLIPRVLIRLTKFL